VSGLVFIREEYLFWWSYKVVVRGASWTFTNFVNNYLFAREPCITWKD